MDAQHHGLEAGEASANGEAIDSDQQQEPAAGGEQWQQQSPAAMEHDAAEPDAAE